MCADKLNATNQFLEVIDHLRTHEEVLIHANGFQTGSDFDGDLILYLEREYNNEQLNFPYEPPHFDEGAALWGAKTVYTASNLLLKRNELPENLPGLLTPFEGEILPGGILSADLCMRFLPAIIEQAKLIDPDDILIALLEDHLNVWHYSAIGYFSTIDHIDFEFVTENDSLLQLYVDRIINRKSISYLNAELLTDRINGSLGTHKKQFWPEL